MKNKGDRSLVLDRYPFAYAQKHGDSHTQIFDGPVVNCKPLSDIQPSKRKAWKDAIERIGK